MHVTCIASPVAYVDEEHPHDHGALNLVPEVELVPIHEGRAIPGGDRSEERRVERVSLTV